ncbi:glycosyltransferase [Catenisphaera adipataccumulans]|uniref:Glycosyltransferase 2-like domain-containing protein n=1 Tax=Catenisphaera adipataccumulans TaxID=700500 RepID=A0A7W8CWI5_9FIRM|nr:glycosyltransferase [Catenisphaera adipataccumulans]MBB5182901.1 hypothetical protein [Catenisphaera adipataccumulans]
MYSIIVVYNKKITDSQTYRAMRLQPDMDIIVCDNSTIDHENEVIVHADGYTYVPMGGNQGLSKAYNEALKKLAGKEGYVILMDDDTLVSDHYFQCVRHAVRSGKDIYLPYVSDGSHIISPAFIDDGIVKNADAYDSIPYQNLTAINSGMVLNLDLFRHYRFDEGLFLDYVDHQFLTDMKHRNKQIEIMDVTIRQTFSANNFDKQKAMERFKIFKKDSAYFYRNHKQAYRYVVGKRRAHLLMMYKDPRILAL